MAILPAPPGEGGTEDILHLPEALGRYPDHGIYVYNRVSSYDQAGKGKLKLEEKTRAVVEKVRELAPGKLRAIISGIEEGKLSKPRRKLLDAAERAAKGWRGPMMLVASDLSRFIRSEDYDRRINIDARPTPDEFARLRAMTRGLVLATLAHPSMTESERHSLATKRNDKCGRPRTITPELWEAIFRELGCAFPPWRGRGSSRGTFERPMAEVAEKFGVSPGTISKQLRKMSPAGVTWLMLAYRKSAERGLVEICPNGDVVYLDL